jgi:hypothetical protein
MAYMRLLVYFVKALLQMQDVSSAVSALQFFTNVQPTIRFVTHQCTFFFLFAFYLLTLCFDVEVGMCMSNSLLTKN